MEQVIPKRFNHKEMGERSKVYFIPVNHVGTSSVSLRLVPTKNNQQHGVRLAQDYEI